MLEARAQLAGQRRIVEHVAPVQQQVVVVEHALRLLFGHVGAEQRLQLGRPAGAPRIALLQHLLQRLLAVDHARVDRQAGALERKARVGLRQTLLVAQQAEQVFAVAAVGNGEGRVQADARRVVAQQPRADAVEGAGPGQGGRRLRGAEAQRLVQHAAARAAAATAPRGARSSAAGCAADRRRPAPAGPRARPASASCPSRRRRRSAAAAARRRRSRGRGTPPGAARRSGCRRARAVGRRVGSGMSSMASSLYWMDIQKPAPPLA